MIVHCSTYLNADAETAWKAVQRTATFLYVTHGLLGWGNSSQFPETWRLGIQARSRLFLFGFLPGWIHELEITRVDDQNREFQTKEHGGLVRAWNHSIKVEPESQNRCRYTDKVEIKAGLLTPMIWLFALLFFRYRQMRLRGYVRS